MPQVGNTFQWTDNFTKTVGKHTFKFGGDVPDSSTSISSFILMSTVTFSSSAFKTSVTRRTWTQRLARRPQNDVGFSSAYPNYFLGTPSSYTQGAAQVKT